MASPATPAAALDARQARVVTQTITRPFTTITAVVTLGDDLPTSTSTTSPLPTTTSTADAVPPATSSDTSSLTPQQLGAILGSVLGFALLVLLFCFYISIRRRQQRQERDEYIVDYDSFSESEVVAVPVSGGGGWGWSAQRPRPAASTWTTVPAPVRFPPTPRYTPYRQTREAQIDGIRTYR